MFGNRKCMFFNSSRVPYGPLEDRDPCERLGGFRALWAQHGPLEDRDTCERLGDFPSILGATSVFCLGTEALVNKSTFARAPIVETCPKRSLDCFSIVNEYVMLYGRNRNCGHCCMPGKMLETHMATPLKVLWGI